MHKITSNFYDLRKILTKKFWSQGTLLGSPGPGSQADVGLGFCRFQFLVIWGPHEGPAPLVSQGTPKNLKVAGAWCDCSITHVVNRGLLGDNVWTLFCWIGHLSATNPILSFRDAISTLFSGQAVKLLF